MSTNPYTKVSAETHPELNAIAGRGGAVVIPHSDEEGGAIGFGVLENYTPPPVALCHTEHGPQYVDLLTEQPVPPPPVSFPRFKGQVEPDEPRPAPAVAPAADLPKPKSKQPKKPAVSKTAKAATPTAAGKVVKIHAGGVVIPVTYADVIVDSDKGMVVLVSEEQSGAPDFAVYDGPSSLIKLVIDGVTFECANVNLSFTWRGFRFTNLVVNS